MRRFAASWCFLLVLFLCPVSSSLAEEQDLPQKNAQAQAQAQDRATEHLRKHVHAFYDGDKLRLTSSESDRAKYIEIAKEVRQKIVADLQQEGFQPQVIASAVNTVFLNSPTIRDPCTAYTLSEMETGVISPRNLENASKEKAVPLRPPQKPPEGIPPSPESIVTGTICKDGKDVIAGVGLLDPSSISKQVSEQAPTPNTPSTAQTTPQENPLSAGNPEPAKPELSTAGSASSPQSEPNLTPSKPAGLAQSPASLSSPPKPKASDSAPSEPPTYGPNSTPDLVGVTAGGDTDFRTSSQHTPSQFQVTVETPAAVIRSHPTERPTIEAAREGSPSPVQAAQNFQAVKEALDEKVASGQIEPHVASAVLSKLKPILKTEPDLVRALTSVHDSIQSGLPSPPAAIAPGKGNPVKGEDSSENAFKTNALPRSEPKAFSSATTGTPSSAAASAPGSPSVVVLGGVPPTFASSTTDPLAKSLASKLNERNAPAPPEKAAIKVPSGAAAALLVKSAMSLGENTSVTSAFPMIPSKATRSPSRAESPSVKIDKGNLGKIISQISELFSKSVIHDSATARAISSTTAEQLGGEADNPLTFLAMAGSRAEGVSWDGGFGDPFLSDGIGAFLATFGAFLGGFRLWYMRRQKRPSK
jgi:hypothetical protein